MGRTATRLGIGRSSLHSKLKTQSIESFSQEPLSLRRCEVAEKQSRTKLVNIQHFPVQMRSLPVFSGVPTGCTVFLR